MTKAELQEYIKELEADLKVLFSWTNSDTEVTEEEAEAVFNKLNGRFGVVKDE